MSSGPQVFKFGGVAVGSAEAVRAAAGHVRRAGSPLAVVVSAMNGVTDLLHDAAAAALRGDRPSFELAAKSYDERHAKLIDEIITTRKRRDALRDMLTESTTE